MSDAADLPASWGADEGSPPRRRRGLLWAAVAVVIVVVGVGAFFALRQVQKNVEKEWPARWSGPPSGLDTKDPTASGVAPDIEPGAYLWNDFQGWHLWVVMGDGVGPVQGTLTSDKDFDDVALATARVGSMQPKGGQISFSFPADAKVAGIDFSPGFYAEKIELKLSKAIPVFEGGAKKRSRSPVVIDKLDADDPLAAGNG